ncbi:MAG: hypothetical protein ACI9CD_000941 [Candidatus Deianiraeaceae bacterium]|jgi:hypothetical protein
MKKLPILISLFSISFLSLNFANAHCTSKKCSHDSHKHSKHKHHERKKMLKEEAKKSCIDAPNKKACTKEYRSNKKAEWKAKQQQPNN